MVLSKQGKQREITANAPTLREVAKGSEGWSNMFLEGNLELQEWRKKVEMTNIHLNDIFPFLKLLKLKFESKSYVEFEWFFFQFETNFMKRSNGFTVMVVTFLNESYICNII
jgi:hypothetical protein